MKSRLLVCLAVVALLASSCRAAPPQALNGGLTITKAPAVMPTWNAPKADAVIPYQDVRGKDLQGLGASLNKEVIKTLWFGSGTVFPLYLRDVAWRDVLVKAKSPGLWIWWLHAQGITGKGVHIGIIGQDLGDTKTALPYHPEYGGKIARYRDIGGNKPSYRGSLQGPPVTSLLVGESVGTAPGAHVTYIALPSWTADAQYYADALNWLLDQNQYLAPEDRVRLVVVAASPSGGPPPYIQNSPAWDAAYERAMRVNVLVLDYSSEHGVTAPCYCDLDDPDNVTRCKPGWPGAASDVRPDRLYVPVSQRTYADGAYGYQYTGHGDPSWSVAYLAGVLAMGRQVCPDLTLTAPQLLDIVFQTAYVGEGQARIINPPAFIEAVKKVCES